jgi:hypothetical protein
MFKKLNPLIVIARCTAGGVIAYAYYERHAASDPIPAVAFYLAAATICVLPSLYAEFRRRRCCLR